jgi:hypothetical protein
MRGSDWLLGAGLCFLTYVMLSPCCDSSLIFVHRGQIRQRHVFSSHTTRDFFASLCCCFCASIENARIIEADPKVHIGATQAAANIRSEAPVGLSAPF